MALPATDNFNRADGALGANWAGSVDNDLTIVSNAVRGVSAGANSTMMWNADTPDAAQYAQCKLAATGAGQYAGPTVRTSATDFIMLDALGGSSYQIEWYNGGGYTVIGSAYGTSPATNDILKITADGTTYKGYVNGVERISGTNTSAPSTGKGGLYVYGSSASSILDDFEVGNLAAGATGKPLYAYAQQ